MLKQLHNILLIFLMYRLEFIYCDTKGCSKQCECSENIANCSNRNLEKTPTDLPRWIDTLNLNKNLLDTVPVIDAINLTRLILSHNRIFNLDTNTFQRFPLLKTLDLSSNHLPKIQRNFFPNMTHLKTLIINNNFISTIEEGSLSGLSILSELKLNRNYLTDLDKDLFNSVYNLRILELNRNRLTEIIGLSFSGLKHLTLLKIKQNHIHSLMDGSFWGLNDLITLQLDENKIVNVSKGWLMGLRSLNNLSLSHNAIKTIQDGWESCKNLVTLDLSHNHLKEIEMNTFEYLGKLQHLKLNSNQISSIADGAFNHTPSLRKLEMNNNMISWAFEDTNGVFSGLKQLTKLDLASNKITSIPPKAFLGLDSLIDLDLRGNSILTLQENAFESLHLLNVVLINTTSLICDCSLSWFPTWLQQFSSSVQSYCDYPSQLKGALVTEIPPDGFFCVPNDSLKPVIVEEPLPKDVLAGSSVQLTCIAKSSSENPMTFKWKRNNQEIEEWTSTNSGTQEWIGRKQRSDLKLFNVTIDHSAKYQCIISNAFGTTYSQKVQLNVLVFPVLIKKPSNVTAKAGNTARLDCAAIGQPPPQIAWQKDGGNEFPAAQERRMHVMPTDDEFFIVNVKAMDTGVYTCTARNKAGSVIANASLTVLEAASFRMNMQDVTVTAGDAVVLKCLASGSPKPNLTWTKDGSLVPTTNRHFLTADGELLVITNAQFSDAGKYECEITNTLGSNKGKSQLTVLPVYGSVYSLTDGNMMGVIMITVVCCAVLTSCVWVIIIYHTRKRHQRNCSTPDNLTNHSSLNKENSATKMSHNNLLLGTVECMTHDRVGQVALPEVSLPLLTTIHPYGDSAPSSSLGVLKDGAVVMPCCQSNLIRTDHDRCSQKPYLCLYVPSHQRVKINC